MMKTKVLLACSLLLMVFTTSCNFTENITIQEDGSGTMSLGMDGSQVMKIAGKQFAKEGKTKIDSTISFREIFAKSKDSIAKLPNEEQEVLKRIEKMDVHMLMDPETSEMQFSMELDFDKTSELTDMMKAFSDLSGLKNAKTVISQPSSMFYNKGYSVSYLYRGNKFIKKVKRNKKDKSKKEKLPKMYEEIFSQSTYTINYTFPRKVKSVSNKNAVISEDRKTVTVTYPFLYYYNNTKKMGIKVKLER